MAYDYDTVGDLKAILAKYPDDQPIALAVDPEGNGFGRLSDHSEQLVDPEDYRPEEIAPTPEDYQRGLADGSYTEDDEPPPDWQRVLVLWPA